MGCYWGNVGGLHWELGERVENPLGTWGTSKAPIGNLQNKLGTWGTSKEPIGNLQNKLGTHWELDENIVRP